MGLVFNPLSGQWDIKGSGGGGGGPADRFIQTFNATTDWGSPSGGYYTITVLGLTHGLGVDPNVQVYETIAGVDYLLLPDEIRINGSGDIAIRVLQSPDLRFAGKILII